MCRHPATMKSPLVAVMKACGVWRRGRSKRPAFARPTLPALLRHCEFTPTPAPGLPGIQQGFNLCLLFSCLLSLSQGCGLWMPSRAHGRAKISVVRQQQGNGDRGTSAPKPTCTVHDPPCPGSYRVFIPINPKKDGFRFCGGNNLVHGCKEETWVFGGNAG